MSVHVSRCEPDGLGLLGVNEGECGLPCAGSLVDEAWEDPATALDMAAATGVVEGCALLGRVCEASGVDVRALAERVGVCEGRVAEVLGGEENLRLSTVSRFLFAMGFRLVLSAVEVDGGMAVGSRRGATGSTLAEGVAASCLSA